MTNKYLEKLAKADDKKKSNWRVGSALAGAAGAHVGVTSARLLYQPKMISGLAGAETQASTHVNMKDVKSFIKDKNVSKEVTFSTHRFAKHISEGHPKGTIKQVMSEAFSETVKGKPHTGPFYFRAPFITTPKSKAYIQGRGFFSGNTRKPNAAGTLHELGHHLNNKNSVLRRAGYLSRGRAGFVTGLGLATNEKTKNYAVPVTALAELPYLYDEHAASRKALNHITKTRGADVTNKVSPYLKKAFGTHAIASLARVGTVAGAAYLLNKGNKKSNTAVNSTSTQGKLKIYHDK